MNGLKVDKEQFATFNIGEQISIIFDNTEQILEILSTKEITCRAQIQACADHFKEVEKVVGKSKILDKLVAAVTGAVTALVAMFGKDKLL
jgi:hypothetical protein